MVPLADLIHLHVDEIDPYKKPKELVEISPKSLVPAIKLNNYSPPRGLNESMVILEFLEDLAACSTHRSLMPPRTDPYARALVRLQEDYVKHTIVPLFYRYIQAQEASAQEKFGKEFGEALEHLTSLFERAEREIVETCGVLGEGEKRARMNGLGLWMDGGNLGWTDVVVGPWLFRATNALKHYRGFELPMKTKEWVGRLVSHPAFKSTCSDEELYISSYERYAKDRANTLIGNLYRIT